jgi:hypothetical protein
MSHLELKLNSTPVASRRKHFTVEQANRALVLLKRVVADVILGYRELHDLQEALDVAQIGHRARQARFYSDRLRNVVARLQTCLDELREVGVEIRDWSLGVVDFPAMAGGREVCLCWQFGEPRVMYWHEMDEGDSGRKPIETLPLCEPMSHSA